MAPRKNPARHSMHSPSSSTTRLLPHSSHLATGMTSIEMLLYDLTPGWFEVPSQVLADTHGGEFALDHHNPIVVDPGGLAEAADFAVTLQRPEQPRQGQVEEIRE